MYCISGELEGFFKSSRGLRQGDPISPYLFVIAMEAFAKIVEKEIMKGKFEYHWRCKESNITHLCFADDLIMFCRADKHSIRTFKDALDIFQYWSGLGANSDKSNIFLSRVG